MVSDGQGVVIRRGAVEPGAVPSSPRFVAANRIETWLLRSLGFAAICWPWKRIAILPEWLDHQTLRKHELIHCEQIDRHGPVWFSVLAISYLLWYGYKRSPFEIEAYRRQME